MNLPKSKGRIILEQLKDIVLESSLFEYASFGKVKEITEEDQFNKCYILEFDEEMEHSGDVTDAICGYDRYMTVDFHMNLSFTEELEYKDIQEQFERILVGDSLIWTNAGILDREVQMAAWDNNEAFDDGKKQGMLRFKFRYRIN